MLSLQVVSKIKWLLAFTFYDKISKKSNSKKVELNLARSLSFSSASGET